MVSIVSNGDAARGMKHTDGDVAIADEVRDVGQIRRDDTGVVGDDPVFYAAIEIAAFSLATIFQGSNSSMRLMG
jgi:hypothetical protein